GDGRDASLQDGSRGTAPARLPVDESGSGRDRGAARGLTADPRRAVAKLSFYGGVGEIGGNKILVEDRDARIWLDMGAPFDLGEEDFVEFLQPRERFGLRDYFAPDLMKRSPGLYPTDALHPTHQ